MSVHQRLRGPCDRGEETKLPDLSVFQTDLRQIFGFIRCAEDIERLRELVAGDPAFQELDEDAYAMMAEYGNAKELLGIKKYKGKDGKVDMCKGIMGMVEEGRMEGRTEGRAEGRMEGRMEGRKEVLIQQVLRKLRKRKSAEEIAEDLEEPLESVKQICKAVEICGTEDPAEIYKSLKSHNTYQLVQ